MHLSNHLTHHVTVPRYLPIVCSSALMLLALMLLPEPPAAAAEQPLFKLRPVPFQDVTIQDSFWAPRRETNRTASIPFSLQKLEEAGNLEDMRLAARHATNGYQGPVFMDSDLYKALEAAAYSLATHPDPALEKQLDGIIQLLAAAQQPDGYLNSYFTVKDPASAGPTCAIATNFTAPATCSRPPWPTTRPPARPTS